MERKAVVVCLMVIFLSLLSTTLAFAAEITRIQGSGRVRRVDSECLYPTTPASLYGVLSTFIFMLAHVTIYGAAGCLCFKRRGNHYSYVNWILGSICYIVSWTLFLPAVMLLLHGALQDDQQRSIRVSTSSRFVTPHCDIASGGVVFATGGLLVLMSNLLGLVYYISVSPIIGIVPIGRGDIAMGHPQLPPPTTPATAQQMPAEPAPVPPVGSLLVLGA